MLSSLRHVEARTIKHGWPSLASGTRHGGRRYSPFAWATSRSLRPAARVQLRALVYEGKMPLVGFEKIASTLGPSLGPLLYLHTFVVLQDDDDEVSGSIGYFQFPLPSLTSCGFSGVHRTYITTFCHLHGCRFLHPSAALAI
jgi:hypothetical protein